MIALILSFYISIYYPVNLDPADFVLAADQEDASLVDQEDPPVADQEDPSPEDQEDAPPADQEDAPPEDQEDSSPEDQKQHKVSEIITTYQMVTVESDPAASDVSLDYMEESYNALTMICAILLIFLLVGLCKYIYRFFDIFI